MSERFSPTFLGAHYIDSVENALEALRRRFPDDSDVLSCFFIPARMRIREHASGRNLGRRQKRLQKVRSLISKADHYSDPE